MQSIHRSLYRAGTKRPFYFGMVGFLAGFISMAATINSNVVVERLGEGFITPVYIGAALIAGLFFLVAPSILSRIGNRTLFLIAAAGEVGALVALGLGGPVATLIALLFFSAAFGAIWLSLDVFFEHSMCREEETGTARGIYLTFQNIAYAAAPFAAGAITGLGGFTPTYLIAALIFALLIVIMTPAFRSFEDPVYPNTSVPRMMQALSENRAARLATLSNLFLRFYLSVAIIYIPLLLRLEYGFSWPEVGLMLGISTIPYALFELPLGRLADRLHNEGVLLASGFIVLAISTTLLGLPLPHDIGLLTAILFLQGAGAAAVEILTETHFFRAVSAENSNVISLFRLGGPIGIVSATIIGGIALPFLSLPLSFFIFGACIAVGVFPALGMRRRGTLPGPEQPPPVLEKPAGTPV